MLINPNHDIIDATNVLAVVFGLIDLTPATTLAIYPDVLFSDGGAYVVINCLIVGLSPVTYFGFNV